MDTTLKSWIVFKTGLSSDMVFKAKSPKHVTEGFAVFKRAESRRLGPSTREKFATGDQEFVGERITGPREIRVLIDIYDPNGWDLMDDLADSLADQSVIDLFKPDVLFRFEGSIEISEIENNKYPYRIQGVFLVHTTNERTNLIDKINGVVITGTVDDVEYTTEIGVVTP
jgi:hypothetical protein